MALEKKKNENDELKFLFYIKHYKTLFISVAYKLEFF